MNSRTGASEKILQLAVEQSFDGLIVLDNSGHPIEFNTAARDILGLGSLATPSDLNGQCGFKKADGSKLEWEDSPWRQALKGEIVTNVDLLIENSAVGKRDAIVDAKPLYDGQQQIGALVVIRQTLPLALQTGDGDAESLQQTRNVSHIGSVAKNSEVFRLMVETVKDYAIFLLDPTGVVMTWNAGAQRIQGYTASEIIGKHFSAFYTEDKKAIKHPQHELEIASREGRYEEEGWRVRKDGSLLWASIVITAIRSHDGRLIGFAKVTRDLTERKKAEDKLRQLNEELARALSAKDVFLANMSHELRTPLNSILGFNEVMLMGLSGELNEQQKKQAGFIKQSGEHLLSLINDILDLAKIESGRMEFHPSAVDLTALISDVLATLEPLATERGLYLLSDVPGPLPTLFVDARALRQILTNLISNAIKFTDSGGVTVSARLKEDVIAIAVKDTGIGISADDQGKLFKGFVQLIRAERKQEGTGLGLALSKRLAQLMDGDITLKSEPGQGSTFTVYIPIKEQGTP